MRIGEWIALPSLPNRAGQFLGTRLSGLWSSMDWLRHSTQGVLEESHRPRGLASRSPVSRRPTVCPHAPTWNGLRCAGCLALRHFAGPFEMSDSRQLTPPSYPPWLHDHYSLLRYYGGSDPDRPFFRRQPWFPDSRQLNFQPCCLQPSVVPCMSLSTPSTHAAHFVGASPFGRRLAKTTYRIEFTLSPRHWGLRVTA